MNIINTIKNLFRSKTPIPTYEIKDVEINHIALHLMYKKDINEFDLYIQSDILLEFETYDRYGKEYVI